jgi:large repetitive protein
MKRSVVVLAAAVGACAHAPSPDPHGASPLAAHAFSDAASVEVRELVRGVSHVVARDERGPWAIHIIEIDMATCRPRMEVRKPAGPLSGRATTSTLAGGAIATINADFFRLPGGTPVGVHVERSVPFIGPTEWPVFAVSAAGEWTYGMARLDGVAVAGADTVALVQLNRSTETFLAYPAAASGGVTLHTARADSVAADGAARRVALRVLDGDERGGRGVVTAIDSPAPAAVVGAGEALLYAHDRAHAWALRRAPGDTVSWQLQITVPRMDGRGALVPVEAVGGFPALLRDGRDVLGTQVVRPSFGEGRHPRTALGWTADGRRAFLVVVDGRQPGHSDGMSLAELSWVFERLGVAHALNLDGGGSTALVVDGRLANRPSDAEGERAVGNALSLVRCSP